MSSFVLRKSIEFCKLFVAVDDLASIRRRCQEIMPPGRDRCIDRASFLQLFAIAPDLADHVFSLFDSRRRNVINASNFILGFSVFTNASNDDKFDLVHSLLCTSHDNQIYRPELLIIIDLIIDNASIVLGINIHESMYDMLAGSLGTKIVKDVFSLRIDKTDTSISLQVLRELANAQSIFDRIRTFVLNLATQSHNFMRICPEPFPPLRFRNGQSLDTDSEGQIISSDSSSSDECISMLNIIFPELCAVGHGTASFAGLATVLAPECCIEEGASMASVKRTKFGFKGPDEDCPHPDTRSTATSETACDGSIILQGYVWKQIWFLKRMRRRWIVLRNNVLYSYHKETSKKPNLVLSLAGAVCHPLQNEGMGLFKYSKSLFAFQLVSKLCHMTRIILLPSLELRDRWVEVIRVASRSFVLSEHYHMSSVVHPCLPNMFQCRGAHSGKDYMLKYIDKYTVDSDDLPDLRIESGVLRFADHPDISGTVALYEDQTKIYIIRPYIPSWVRIDEILQAGGIMSINSVGLIMRQVLSGLSFLHERKCPLGVLGTANIVLHLRALRQHRIQLDISLCKFFLLALDEQTRTYVAPEVENGSRVTLKADMWSVGAIMYRLLTPGSTKDDLISAKHGGKIDLSRTRAPLDVINALKRLLHKKPSKRLCTAVALRLDFIANATDRPIELKFPKNVVLDQSGNFTRKIIESWQNLDPGEPREMMDQGVMAGGNEH